MKPSIIVWPLIWLLSSGPSQAGSRSADTSAPQNTAADSSATKAAERKQHFAEEKQRIEGQEQPVQTPACQAGNQPIHNPRQRRNVNRRVPGIRAV